MPTQSPLHADPLPWLLARGDPGPRYLALRDLCRLPTGDPELAAARTAAHRTGPIAAVLDGMDPAGFWVKPGHGYGPKYRSTVWAIILLAQLGGSLDEDARIATACRYVLDHALAPGGQFTLSSSGSPSGTLDCLHGNLCWALTQLGCRDERMLAAWDWLACSVTGEGIAPARSAHADRSRQAAQDERAARHESERRYYASLKCGPCFACRVNRSQPCGWGAVKVMLALAAIPPEQRDRKSVV